MKEDLKIHLNGNRKWTSNGLLHREGGPAIITPSDSKRWYLNGRTHRENGPAYISTWGLTEWWDNGSLHRTDGPAIIWPSGIREWFLGNNNLSQKAWLDKILRGVLS